jgi:transposase
MVFIQDNVLIHKVKKILDWLESHDVETTEWPPFSPDLNLVEHVWSWMKQRIKTIIPSFSKWGRVQRAMRH